MAEAQRADRPAQEPICQRILRRMKVTQIVIQNPENLAGLTIAFDRGGRVIISAIEPMPHAVMPPPSTPMRQKPEVEGSVKDSD